MAAPHVVLRICGGAGRRAGSEAQLFGGTTEYCLQCLALLRVGPAGFSGQPVTYRPVAHGSRVSRSL
jgi:hypothetical protein